MEGKLSNRAHAFTESEPVAMATLLEGGTVETERHEETGEGCDERLE